MRDSILERQVWKQVTTELPAWLSQWDQYLQKSSILRQEGKDWALPGLPSFQGMVQQTRNLSRLIWNEASEMTAVALEALLTLSPETELPCDESTRKALVLGMRGIRMELHTCVSPHRLSEVSATLSEEEPLPPLALIVDKLLFAVNKTTSSGAYGGPCSIYTVKHEGEDASPLRLRGLDLFRLEQENLSLYLLEIPWGDILERNRGLLQLLDYMGRNGHVFDMRPTLHFLDPSVSPQEHIFRILYGSPLDQDFVEALTRMPPEHIHKVNSSQVRRNQPSWGATPSRQPVEHLFRQGCQKSIEELTLEYNNAFKQMEDPSIPLNLSSPQVKTS